MKRRQIAWMSGGARRTHPDNAERTGWHDDQMGRHVDAFAGASRASTSSRARAAIHKK